jgi:hypothetical protein
MDDIVITLCFLIKNDASKNYIKAFSSIYINLIYGLENIIKTLNNH